MSLRGHSIITWVDANKHKPNKEIGEYVIVTDGTVFGHATYDEDLDMWIGCMVNSYSDSTLKNLTHWAYFPDIEEIKQLGRF